MEYIEKANKLLNELKEIKSKFVRELEEIVVLEPNDLFLIDDKRKYTNYIAFKDLIYFMDKKLKDRGFYNKKIIENYFLDRTLKGINPFTFFFATDIEKAMVKPSRYFLDYFYHQIFKKKFAGLEGATWIDKNARLRKEGIYINPFLSLEFYFLGKGSFDDD